MLKDRDLPQFCEQFCPIETAQGTRDCAVVRRLDQFNIQADHSAANRKPNAHTLATILLKANSSCQAQDSVLRKIEEIPERVESELQLDFVMRKVFLTFSGTDFD